MACVIAIDAERRDSGLHKICETTEIQDDYKPEFLPVFEVAPGAVRVTLWDMNYRKEDATQQVSP